MTLQELLGEELYKQVIEKCGDKTKIAITSDGSWVPKEKFDAVNTEKNDYKTQIDNLNKDLGKLQKAVEDNKDATATIDNLKQQIKDKEAALTETRKQFAIESAIKEGHGKNAKAIKALLDMSKVEMDEQGKITGLTEQLKKLQESDSYLFDEVDPDGTGGSKGNGGKGNKGQGTKNPWKKESFNLTEQGRILREDPELARTLMAQAKE